MSIKETVAIVAHDSGGSEILSSWVLKSHYNYIFVIQGPAKSIFLRKIPNIKIHGLYDAVNKCDWVLTETGGSTDLNYKAILTAKKKGKRVVSFLDHWNEYIGRFKRNSILILPDEIWAGDIDSYNLARLNFPQKIVKLKDNPYWKDILENYDKEKSDIESDDSLVHTPINYEIEGRKSGLIKSVKLGRGEMSSVSSKGVYKTISDNIKDRPYFLTKAEEMGISSPKIF